LETVVYDSYYDVGGDQFANVFQALDHANHTKKFCYFNIHKDWINALEQTYSVPKPNRKTLQVLYLKKLKQLRQNHNKLVLAYSGGTDSHTILKIAIDNDIYFDEVIIEYPGVMEAANDQIINAEQIMALEFVNKHIGKSIGKVTVIKWNEKDYEYLNHAGWYKNPKFYQHNKIKVRPCVKVYMSKHYNDLDGVIITGHEKQGVRFKNNKFYWFVTDTGTTEHKIIRNAFPFFLDPEIVVSYAYVLRDQLKGKLNYFTQIGDRYDFFWKIPLAETKKFYESLGLEFINHESVKFTQKPNWGTHHNYKNKGIINSLEKYGHTQILDKIYYLHEHINNEYKNTNHAVQSDGTFVKTVERYSQMFEYVENGLICRGHDV